MARRGWKRLGRKRFRYEDSRGRAITNEEDLARIRDLVIPPAWSDVWISPYAGAKLQATGTDAAGRRQYLYHPHFRASQERAKFERLLDFAEALPTLRARMARHLRLGPYEHDWACAIAVGLVDRGWFRIGTDRHARESRTYGITTLTKRHVTVSGNAIDLRFRTKNRTLVRKQVQNAGLAREMRELVRLDGGARLFRFERDDERVNLRASLLNDYIAEHLGDGFTAKDFRTWGGTLLAAVELAKRGRPAKENEAETKRILAAVMRKVGQELGNTPAVARASYVSPAVIEQYEAGRSLEDFRRKTARPARLSADERALLRLLRASTR